MTSFKKTYESWGPRLEDTLRNATYLAVEHGGTLCDVLPNIPKYHAYVHYVAERDARAYPFSMTTLAPEPVFEDRAEKVRRASNARYARPKGQVLTSLGVANSFQARNGTFGAQTL